MSVIMHSVSQLQSLNRFTGVCNCLKKDNTGMQFITNGNAEFPFFPNMRIKMSESMHKKCNLNNRLKMCCKMNWSSFACSSHIYRISHFNHYRRSNSVLKLTETIKCKLPEYSDWIDALDLLDWLDLCCHWCLHFHSALIDCVRCWFLRFAF